MIKRFSVWAEERTGQDFDSMRRILFGYLGLNLNPRQGLSIRLDQLDLKSIAEKIEGWSFFQDRVSETGKGTVRQLLATGNGTVGDLVRAMSTGPTHRSQLEPEGSGNTETY